MANILVIDDEADLRTMVRETLETVHTVIEASNGIEAMKRFKSADFDLVITDIFMPDQEGFETMQQMLALRPRQKILAISGGGTTKSMEFLRLAEHLGAQRMLKKPFGPAVLRATVQTCLDTE